MFNLPTFGAKLIMTRGTFAWNDRTSCDCLTGKRYDLDAGQIVTVLSVREFSATEWKALVQDEHGSFAWVHHYEVKPHVSGMDGTVTRFIETIALAAWQLRAGDPFAAGSAYEAARQLSWKIHDGTMHERAQTLCAAVVSAYLSAHASEARS